MNNKEKAYDLIDTATIKKIFNKAEEERNEALQKVVKIDVLTKKLEDILTYRKNKGE